MTERGSFGSKLGVVLASAGSAVGLGNIWRFPTEVGENGGAAFILVYLVCVVLIGMPVMLSEFVIGRHTRTNTAEAYQQLAPGKWWRIQGGMGVFVSFFILCYYVVVSGWTLYYAFSSLIGALQYDGDDATYFSSVFDGFVSDTWQPILFAVIFMLMVHYVITKGVQNGIEKFSKIMMPMLLLIIGVLAVCAFSLPGTKQGLSYLLKPDFSKLTASTVLSAIGQAFFSLSIAMGCLCTYASYFRKDTNLAKTAYSVCVIDTLVALMSGFIIFPAVFSVPGLDPGEGAGLVFKSLPYIFSQAFQSMPVMGYVFSLLFYLLLFLAALTSAISIHEPVTAYLHESHNMTRKKAALWVSVACLALGVLCSLSFGVLKDFTLFGNTIFDNFDALPSVILMPVGGIIISLFTGWYLDKKLVRDEITNQGKLTFRFFTVYIFLLRWIIPVAIGLVFINQFVKIV